MWKTGFNKIGLYTEKVSDNKNAHTLSLEKIWQPHVVIFAMLLSPAKIWKRFNLHVSDKSPLQNPVQEHRELLSCHSTRSMHAWVCVCVYPCLPDVAVRVSKQGMTWTRIGGTSCGMSALFRAHWLDAQHMPLWGPHKDNCVDWLAPLICMHGLRSGAGRGN